MSTVSKLYSKIRKYCDKVGYDHQNQNKINDDSFGHLSRTSQQIDFVLNEFNLAEEYENSFVKIIKNELNEKQKSIDKALHYKQCHILFKNLIDISFIDKAMDNINMAIIHMPIVDNNGHDNDYQMQQLFSLRSSLHLKQMNYDHCLTDLDHALNIRLSCTLIERKIEILKRMQRFHEAFNVLTAIINQNDHQTTLSIDKLDKLKKLRKQLKQSFKDDDRDGQLIQESKDDIDQLFDIKIDRRVKIVQKQCERYDFQAQTEIESNTEIINEQAMIITLSYEFRFDYCHNCYKNVTNIFWPCHNCVEIVFCSKKCANDAWQKFHQFECGLISFMCDNLCSQSITVYRDFFQLINFDTDTFYDQLKTFSLETCWQQLVENDGTKNLTLKDVQQWFFYYRRELHNRIVKRKPLRHSTELCNAIILFMIYCFKMKINLDKLDKQNVIDFIENFAISLVQTQINEYSWQQQQKQNSTKDKLEPIATFQCLFGSQLNHGCEPNAEWIFDGKKFMIKTIKHIQTNESIRISYGLPKDYPLLKRQRQLQNFYLMCDCKRCLNEIENYYFAIRCDYCNGPIPFDMNEFANNWCIICEQQYHDSKSIMMTIEQQFKIVQRSLCLVSCLTDDDRRLTLETIEKMMSSLAGYLYLKSKLFIRLVLKLCDYYVDNESWTNAIEWYQWFVKVANIHLSAIDNDNDLVHYNQLDKWTNVFLNYLEQKKYSYSFGETFSTVDDYVQTLQCLLNEQQKLLKTLSTNTNRINMDVIDALQMKNIIICLEQNLKDAMDRFMTILNGINRMNLTDEQIGHDDDDDEKLRSNQQIRYYELSTSLESLS